MVDLIIFIFVCYGLTSILTSGKIFEGIRPEHDFFRCSMCIGFWVGLFLGLFFPIIAIPNFSLISWLSAGWLSSGTSYILDKLFGDDGININLKIT